jgi:ADP-heptose:LPS heptosyltransferase
MEEVQSEIHMDGRIIIAAGCSLDQVGALIQSADLYLGIDNGITHLACFLRARVIVAAHSGTAVNWLPFYCPTATVLYRLEEDEEVHQSREYLHAQRRGRVKPFGAVPPEAICAALDECLDTKTMQRSRSTSHDKVLAGGKI